MRADRRGRIRAFLDEKMFQCRVGIDLPVERQSVLHRNPDFLAIEILDAYFVFDRAVLLPNLPFPRKAQVR